MGGGDADAARGGRRAVIDYAGLVLRSVAFNLLFVLWSTAFSLTFWPLLVLPAHRIAWLGRWWARGVLVFLALTVGLRHEVRGLAHRPRGPAIVASKHQSAWDTVVFFLLHERLAYVLKAELLLIPIIGWYLARVGMIAIDRRGGARALRSLIARARRAVAEGRTIVIFPEGTRTAPGTRRPYQPGVAALYAQLDLPVVPVALNSGRHWRRRAFLKRRGTIVLEYLPPIPPGLDRETFTATLETRIENAVARLDKTAAPADSQEPNRASAG
jgi:1-acyl-sn-glycerol-3-phosphate acyltransferase